MLKCMALNWQSHSIIHLWRCMSSVETTWLHEVYLITWHIRPLFNGLQWFWDVQDLVFWMLTWSFCIKFRRRVLCLGMQSLVVVQAKNSNQAQALCHEMQIKNIKLDKVTMVKCLSACSQLGSLDVGFRIVDSPFFLKDSIFVDVTSVLLQLTCIKKWTLCLIK